MSTKQKAFKMYLPTMLTMSTECPRLIGAKFRVSKPLLDQTLLRLFLWHKDYKTLTNASINDITFLSASCST